MIVSIIDNISISAVRNHAFSAFLSERRTIHRKGCLMRSISPGTILTINGGFSLLSAIILTFNANQTASFLFVDRMPWQEPVLVCGGLALLFFALGLFVAAGIGKLPPSILTVITFADFAWVIASLVACAAFVSAFSAWGIFITLTVASVILSFALLQVQALRLLSDKAESKHEQRVKVWQKLILVAAALGLVTASAAALAGGISAQTYAPLEPEGQVYVVDGQRMHLICMGDLTDTPTILVDMGITNWSLHWSSIQSDIAQQQRVCLYDRPGFGRSVPMLAPPTSEKMVSNLNGLLVAAGERGPFLMVGHSFGGYIIRLYRDQYPSNVAGIVLVEASHEDQWESLPREVNIMVEKAIGMMRLARRLSYTGALRVIALPLGDPLPTETQRTTLARAMTTPQYWQASLAYFDAVPQVAADVRDVSPLGDVPLLVLTAARSADAYCGTQFGIEVPCKATETSWQELQQSFLELSADSRQIIVDDARHYIQLDAPEVVRQSLIDFSRDLPTIR